MWIFILTFSLKSPNKKRNKKHSFNDNLNYLKIWRKKKSFNQEGAITQQQGANLHAFLQKKN